MKKMSGVFLKNLFFFVIISIAFAITSCSPTAPGNPEPARNFTVVSSADMLITLNWDTSPSPDIVEYKILRQRNDGPFDTIATVAAGIYVYADEVNSYEDMFLYRIITVDARGNKSVEVGTDRPRRASDTGAPLAPDSLRASAVNLDDVLGITLAWEVSDADIDYFRIVKWDAQAEVVLDTLVSEDGERNSFFDDSVAVGARYSYHVVAVDFNGGESRPSPTAADAPLAAPVLVDPIRGDVVGAAVVEFMWEPVEFAVRYEVVISQGRRELASFPKDVAVPTPVYERVNVDLNTITNLERGLPVNWEVYTYSQVGGLMNSVSGRETFMVE